MSSSQYLGWGIALAGVGAVSTASTALACGAIPAPSFAFAAQQPDVSVQALPRNGSIVLHVTCSTSPTEAPIVQAASCGLTPLGSKVSLRPTAGGDDVLGRLVVRPEALIFVPAAPLAANTDYTLAVSLGTLDGTSSAGPSFDAMLHTGDALLSPFVSPNPPSVVSEWYDAPITECDNNVKLIGKAALDALAPSICGGPYANCRVASGTQRTLRMHAAFGPLSGGSTALPYAAQLKLSSGGPSAFEGDEGAAPADPPENALPPSGAVVLSTAYATTGVSGSMDLFVDLLPTADAKDMLCVRARAFDAAGQVLYAPDHCQTYVGWMTDAEWAAETASEAAVKMDASTATAQADAAITTAAPLLQGVDAGTPGASPHHDGCSVQPTGPSSAGGVFTWLAISLGLLLGRRRRHGEDA